MPQPTDKHIPAPEGSVWIEQAAPMLGVALSTLRKWRLLGKGPESYTIARRVAFEESVIEEYLAERRAAGRRSPIAA